MRLISICPSNTEICAELGIAGQLAGIDDFSDYPEEITSSLPRLGPDLSIDMDALEQLKPDLVLASLSVPGMEKNVEALKARKIPHIVLNPNSLEEIAASMIEIGQAVGKRKLAQEKAAQFLEEIECFREISKNLQTKPNVFWEWWPNPLFTPGGYNWLTEISMLAGGHNIFSDVELASVQVSSEDVLKRKPDIILLSWVGVATSRMNPDLIRKRAGWQELAAVQEGRIYIMEEELYCRPSPRLLEGLRQLADILHPGTFPLNN
ncbi:cobalamin-binding protein [Bacillus sp. 1P06AnD]|uniref:cobalamin-binding protein n=1 Tax=Bacillus sp. 1P06AnD TaxID=3132208 RepID=UPI0039A237E9